MKPALFPLAATSASDHYRPDIDGLRAVAVLAVVLHHAFPDLVEGGFVGVDVFFVISGYLIGSILLAGMEKPNFSFADFYGRRIRRIFPALTVVLAIVLVMGWLQLLPGDYAQVGKHVAVAGVFLSNLAFWNEAGYFDEASAHKPLLHLWSLAIEEQFYLLWPLVLWVIHRQRASVLGWTGAILIASFLLSLYLVQTDDTAAFYNPAARFWEILMGAFLAAAHGRRLGLADRWPIEGLDHKDLQTFRFANLAAWCGVSLLVFALLSLAPASPFPGAKALLPTLGAALLIAAGPSAWINRRVLSSRLLVGVGLISYPLYLWHWPFLAFSNIKSSGNPLWVHQAGWLLLAVLLAWMTYRFVEKPIRFGLARRRMVSVGLCAGMVIVTSAGFTVHHNGGFDQRFPELVRVLMSKGGRAAIGEGWRTQDCMLNYRQPPNHYKPFCIESARPLVFVWGDSHAGSMYPGFKSLQQSGKYQFGFGERAASICPSILGIEPRPLCKSINESNIQAIREARPDVVILYSKWHHKRYDLRKLPATVEEIKKAGVPRIILLGAVPYWKKNLPQILLEEWRKGPVHARPPLRLGKEYLDPEVLGATEAMRILAQSMNIEFISGMVHFCNPQGCLTRTSEYALQPLSYDYGHLSTGAMEYYVEQIAPLIFHKVHGSD